MFVFVLFVQCVTLCSSHMQCHLGIARCVLHQLQSIRILQNPALVLSQRHLVFWHVPWLLPVLGILVVLFCTFPNYSSLGISGQVLLRCYFQPGVVAHVPDLCLVFIVFGRTAGPIIRTMRGQQGVLFSTVPGQPVHIAHHRTELVHCRMH